MLHQTKRQTLMKNIFLFIVFPFFSNIISAQTDNKIQINTLLDGWHKAAANANFENYFDALTDDAIFIGTDATENWTKSAFQPFAKPYFDNGKAWSFTTIERHIYFSKNKQSAWFDELLSTQMKICRGSGVVIKTINGWKIAHYVLSMTVPNEISSEVIKIKTIVEDKIIQELKK